MGWRWRPIGIQTNGKGISLLAGYGGSGGDWDYENVWELMMPWGVAGSISVGGRWICFVCD